MNDQYSKTLRFDLPRVPILGTLLLSILMFNMPFHLQLFINDNNSIRTALLATVIVFMGIAGLTFAQLVSFNLFNLLYMIKLNLYGLSRSKTNNSYSWFMSLMQQAKPTTRRWSRSASDDIAQREDVKKLDKMKIHAILHALEMELRQKMPAIGTQIEYYYSIYVICFVSAVFILVMFVINIFDNQYQANPFFTRLIDLIMMYIFSKTAINARKMKEQLRLMLINSHRKDAIDMIRKWLHIEIAGYNDSKVILKV